MCWAETEKNTDGKKKKSKQVKKVIKDTCFYYEIKTQGTP